MGAGHGHASRECQGGAPHPAVPGSLRHRAETRHRLRLFLFRNSGIPAGARLGRMDARLRAGPQGRWHPRSAAWRSRPGAPGPLPPHRPARDRPHPRGAVLYGAKAHTARDRNSPGVEPDRYSTGRAPLQGDRPLHRSRGCGRARHQSACPLPLQGDAGLRRAARRLAQDADPHPRLELRLATAVFLPHTDPPARRDARGNGVHLRQLGGQPTEPQPPAETRDARSGQYR